MVIWCNGSLHDIHLLRGVDSTLSNCNFVEYSYMLHVQLYVYRCLIDELIWFFFGLIVLTTAFPWPRYLQCDILLYWRHIYIMDVTVEIKSMQAF